MRPGGTRPLTVPRRAPKPCPRCLNLMTLVGDDWTCPRHGVMAVEPEQKRR